MFFQTHLSNALGVRLMMTLILFHVSFQPIQLILSPQHVPASVSQSKPPKRRTRHSRLTLPFSKFMRANGVDRLVCAHTGEESKHLDAPLWTDGNRCFPKDVFSSNLMEQCFPISHFFFNYFHKTFTHTKHQNASDQLIWNLALMFPSSATQSRVRLVNAAAGDRLRQTAFSSLPWLVYVPQCMCTCSLWWSHSSTVDPVDYSAPTSMTWHCTWNQPTNTLTHTDFESVF